MTSEPREAPQSASQQRLWYLSCVRPDDPFYNIGVAFDLDGPVFPGFLRTGLRELVRRHTVLRSTFGERDGRPVQRVHPATEPDLEVHDLTGSGTSAERAERADDLERELVGRPFALSERPAFRAALIGLGPQQWRLVLSAHHIAFDARSVDVVTDELSMLYRAAVRGEPSPLDELPTQYQDIATAEATQDVGRAGRAYWRDVLAGYRRAPHLDRGHLRSADAGGPATSVELSLSRSTTDAIRHQMHQRGTLFTGLLGGLFLALSRRTGVPDRVVGIATSGRSSAQHDGMVGPFLNTVPVRAQVAADAPVDAVLDTVTAAAAGAIEHSTVPLQLIVQDSADDTGSGRPLIDCVFVMQSGRRSELILGGAGVRRRVPTGRTHVPLSVVMAEEPSGLHGRIEYRSDLVDTADVYALASELQLVYEAIADRRKAPEVPATPLPGPGASPTAATPPIENRTRPLRPVPPPELGVHERVLAWAVEAPSRTAVTDPDSAVSYAELDRRSLLLAGELQRRGVRPGTTVALYLHPSVDFVVAMLATQRAGAAYVPLSVRQPAARAAEVRRVSGSTTLLTHARVPTDVAHRIAGDATIVAVESIDGGSPGAALPPFDPEGLAYIVFTSGSTGSPNGVMVGHSNVTGLLRATVDRWWLGPDDVWLLFHDPAFDFSVWEIWGSLATGGRLVVPGGDDLSDGGDGLLRLVRDHGVTVLNQTPSAFAVLNEADRRTGSEETALRLIVLGGEAIRPADTDEWLGRHPEQPVVLNMYGITEATVHTTVHRLDARTAGSGRGTPIGRPLDGMRTYVLGQDLRPVPPGTPGELYIGGCGVTQGYAGQPDRTAARYLRDLCGKPGARMYRTGDIVTTEPDGSLRYLGRADRQVKLSGYRVELGDVEAAVDAHPEVRACYVIVEDSGGGPRTVCWVVPEAAAPPQGLLRRLRSDLRLRCPAYMIPSAFELIDRMPTTTNGKIDHQALADRRRGNAPAAQPVTEELIASMHRIWIEVFGDAAITMDDEFLNIGGHSLLATRIVSLCDERLGIRPPVRAVFEYPTVRELASALPSWQEPDGRDDPARRTET